METISTKSQDFTCTITANVSPREAAEKIGRVSEWWAKHTEGSTSALNDQFTVRFGDTFVTFKITEAIPDKRITWHVTDCYLHWQNDKTEWNDTDVIFDLVPVGKDTRINFRHRGLVPEVECYNMCVEGWTGHVTKSLLNFLNDGKGQPQ